MNSVKHSTETLSLSICSDKLDNINSRLHTKATLSFIESSLSLSNNNTITVLFYNVTEMVNLTDLNSELTHSLILIDFSEHTVISQSTSQQLITIFIMSDQIDNTSAVRYKHNKDDSSIVIKSALEEGCISTNSVKHNENQGTVCLLFKILF